MSYEPHSREYLITTRLIESLDKFTQALNRFVDREEGKTQPKPICYNCKHWTDMSIKNPWKYQYLCGDCDLRPDDILPGEDTCNFWEVKTDD